MAKLDELHNYAYPDKYLDELHIYDGKTGSNSFDEVHNYGNRGVTYGMDELHLYGSYQTEEIAQDEVNKPTERELIDIDEYFDEIEALDEEQKEERKNLAEEFKDILQLLFALILADLRVGNEINEGFYLSLGKSRCMGAVDRLMPHLTIDVYTQIENYIHQNLTYVIESTIRNQADVYYFSEERATAIAVDDAMASVNLEELELAKKNGVKFKIWTAFDDNKVRPTHREVDGKKVAIDKPFKVGRCLMQAPMIFDEKSVFQDAKEVINCRCSLTWSNQNDNKESSNKEESEYLRNNLPKDFKDERNVGEIISQDEFNGLLSKANNYGIRLGTNNDGGNFQLYRGDINILNRILDKAIKTKEKFKIKDLVLEYDNVLGYKGTNSKIDVEAFAETRGKIIRLNKFMYDDSKYLEEQYANGVETHLFAKGTNYNNVIDHELGHIIARSKPNATNRIIRELNKRAERDNLSLEKYIQDNISIYAGYVNSNDIYSELIPELNSMLNGSNSEFALDLLRIGGVVK